MSEFAAGLPWVWIWAISLAAGLSVAGLLALAGRLYQLIVREYFDAC